MSHAQVVKVRERLFCSRLGVLAARCIHFVSCRARFHALQACRARLAFRLRVLQLPCKACRSTAQAMAQAAMQQHTASGDGAGAVRDLGRVAMVRRHRACSDARCPCRAQLAQQIVAAVESADCRRERASS